MRIHNIISIISLAVLLVACGNKKKEGPDYSRSTPVPKEVKKTEEPVNTQENSSSTSEIKIDLSNKGIGPVKSVDISKPVDQALADKGAELFKSKCTACHRTTKKFIGPNPTGVLERRSPEWVMNMIMNPEEMVQKDPIAKQLLVKFNGSPMANQNVKEDEARAIVEYFRTLK